MSEVWYAPEGEWTVGGTDAHRQSLEKARRTCPQVSSMSIIDQESGEIVAEWRDGR